MMYTKVLVTTLALSLCSNVLFAKTTLIKNVQGYTLKANELQKFSAIKFTDDKIDRLYSSLNNLVEDERWQVIDGDGATLLPGLIDAHGHVLSYGESLLQVDLVNIASEQKAVQRAVEFANENPKSTWIKGRGWNQVQWPSKEFPTANSLDKYFPDTPVFLERVDGHAVWVNSKAMALAGITAETKSPEGVTLFVMHKVNRRVF